MQRLARWRTFFKPSWVVPDLMPMRRSVLNPGSRSAIFLRGHQNIGRRAGAVRAPCGYSL